MNCHLFYLHLRRVGLPEKQANCLTNGAKRAVLFSQYRALGDEMILKEIHEQVVR